MNGCKNTMPPELPTPVPSPVLKMSPKVAEVCDVTTEAHDLGLIPPGRLGPLAAQARAGWGLTPADVCRATDGLINSRELRLLESGRLAPTEEQTKALFAVLGIALEEITPSRVRLEIDRTQGRLVAGSLVTRVLPDATDQQVFTRYLCLVYALRRVRPGTFLVPRADDLDVLAEALHQNATQSRLHLEHLMRHHRDDLRLGVRSITGRAALPGLGLLVGMTSLGALLMVEAQPLSAMPAMTPMAPMNQVLNQVDIATPVVFERIRNMATADVRNPDVSGDDRHVVVSLTRIPAPGAVPGNPSNN